MPNPVNGLSDADVPALSLPTPHDRLQLALDAGAITGTWFWDVVRDRLTGDRRFARCFGLDETRMEAGIALAEVLHAIHPDDEPRVIELIGDALKNGGAYRAEYRVRQADGQYRWLEANGEVTRDEAGRALTFPGVLVDVHHRKEAALRQAALLRLGDELRPLSDVHDITRVAADLCGTTLSASRAGYGVVHELERRVAIQPDWRRDDQTASVQGLHRFDAFGTFFDDLREGRVVAIGDVAADPRTAAYRDAFAAIGISALLNVPLMEDGRLKGVFLVHDDQAREWRADDALFVQGAADRTWAAIRAAQALDELQALNANLEREVAQRAADRNRLWQLSRDVMLVARFDGVITATNPAWENILGWRPEELAGKPLFDLIHADDRERTAAAAQSMIAGATFANFENRYRHKQGGHRWISWSATPGDGLIIAAGRDISDAKALQLAEEQLRQSQKMEAVGQLTGGVAHDFNNLLTVISTSVALLRRPGVSEDHRTRSIDAISKTVTRAARLTGQLLAFARRQALTPTVFDVAQNVTAVTEMVSTLIGARIQVEMALADDCLVNADPGQFDTALVNLVVNARDAMDSAGRLAIDVRRVDGVPPIRTHPAIAGDFVAVSVADTGSGISALNLERIFEPFYTTKGAGHGTGLGLSQVFGFVKQSGGDVQVESTLGQGTVFTLYFPQARDAKAVAEPGAAPAQAAVVHAGRILVVEDNRDVAAAVEASLRELGYATVHAADAEAALTQLRADAAGFSAVFSDVVMTGMDGVALAREIRRRWPALPIVLTSGYSHVLAQDAEHGFELLPKPYDLDALSRTMYRVTAAADGRAAVARDPSPASAVVRAIMSDAAAETARQAELDSMQILDTPEEAVFDDLVRMAAEICGVPIALMSMVDRGRQWFKAKVGLDATETPREHAFCAHAILQPDRTMVVNDASQDMRFATNPLVTGNPNIRFYAGAPLLTSTGHALGTLCVIAPEARTLTQTQTEMLQFLAAQAVKRLEQRRARLAS